MTVLVGADWDLEKCVLSVLVDGKRCGTPNVQRTPDSVAAFMARFPGQEVRVAIESGDPLWATLWRRGGASVLVFDGKKAHRFGESLNSSGARDDSRSAKDLVAMLQSSAHCEASNDVLSPRATALAELMGLREQYSTETVRCINRLWAGLRQYHPAFARVLSSLKVHWVLRLLVAAPTAQAWNELAAASQQSLLSGSSRAKRSEYTQALSQDWGAVEPEFEQAARALIGMTAHSLQVALDASSTVETKLKAHVAAHPTAMAISAVKGMGSLLSAGIAVALDQATAADGRDAAAKRLGVAPVTARSGTLGDNAPLVKMRRSANQLMRKIGHYIAAQLVVHHAWAKAAYVYYRAHGKSSFESYRCIARSFLRVLVALLRDKADFDESRYVMALKSRGIPWAMGLDVQQAA